MYMLNIACSSNMLRTTLFRSVTKSGTKWIRHFSNEHSRSQNVALTQIQHHHNYLQLDAHHRYNYRWLREHCRCPTCYDYTTNQRTLQQFNKHVKPITTQIRDGNLEVTWDDGHLSMFSLDWLDKSLTSNLTVGESKVKEYLWGRNTISAANIQHVNFERFMKDEEAVKLLMNSVLKYGFGKIQQAPVTHEATIEAAQKIGPLRETLYGKSWVISTNNYEFLDSSYGQGFLGPHTDTTYLNETSRIQVFHCLFHDGSGGETILVDGFKVAQTLRKNNYDAYNILTSNPLSYEFIGKDLHTRGTGPIISLNSSSNIVEYIRYNLSDCLILNTVHFDYIPKFYDAVDAFSHEVNDPNNQYCFKLKPGTILFVNNWRLLHGRNSFTGHRRLCGCYLSFDDWSNKARLFDLIE